jgi:hypothetical protein
MPPTFSSAPCDDNHDDIGCQPRSTRSPLEANTSACLGIRRYRIPGQFHMLVIVESPVQFTYPWSRTGSGMIPEMPFGTDCALHVDLWYHHSFISKVSSPNLIEN